MAHVCSKCSAVNPNDALYCYKDGTLLGAHSSTGSSRNPGIQPFPQPFVFPSGEKCQNFDQLALACCRHWTTARDLLRQGYLGTFLTGLGRTDLAAAARMGAQHTDPDQGLDDLLGEFPTQALGPPKLQLTTRNFDLGTVAIGENKSFSVDLTNQGMRLLSGSICVSPGCQWLTVGTPGGVEKFFQFPSSMSIPVNVVGSRLRASRKTLTGELVIHCNNNQVPIRVKLEVPVKPFPIGVLEGATTPREIAQKAKSCPEAAVRLFENGDVASWFLSNGWVYPVQGQAASGVGAIQQFFEALGLAKAPKVQVDKTFLALEGDIGANLQETLEVRTVEKRPVYAHVTSDQPWLVVNETRLDGRVGTILLSVPQVPNAPGQTLRATVRVAANGNQRFDIPVTLRVSSKLVPSVGTPHSMHHGVGQVPPSSSTTAVPPVSSSSSGGPLSKVGVTTPAFSSSQPTTPVIAYPATKSASAREEKTRFWVHLVPLVTLFFSLLVLILLDFVGVGPVDSGPTEKVDPTPRILIYYDHAPFYPREVSNRQQLQETMMFGILTGPKAGVPPIKEEGDEKNKTLTYFRHGGTNTVVVKLNGRDFVFGNPKHGQFAEPPQTTKNKYNSRLQDSRAVWIPTSSQISVEQLISYVPGAAVAGKGGLQRRLDTAFVRYRITNEDSEDVNVGLRFMLDTLIGNNDGVPFTIPGTDKLVDEKKEFADAKTIPDVILALERPDLKEPGTVAELNLKVGDNFEPPDKVLLTRWPFRESFRWDIPLRNFQIPSPENPRKTKDSAIVVYWAEEPLATKTTRSLGFTYGLGLVTSGTGTIGIHVSPNLLAGQPFRVTGFFSGVQEGEEAKLRLPNRLSLTNGQLTRTIPTPQKVGQPSRVTWDLVASAPGEYKVRVELGNGETQERRILVRSQNLFN
ncbi:MAG: hypothetical protein ACFCD0_14805 [Gemmataceae bacterium]